MLVPRAGARAVRVAAAAAAAERRALAACGLRAPDGHDRELLLRVFAAALRAGWRRTAEHQFLERVGAVAADVS